MFDALTALLLAMAVPAGAADGMPATAAGKAALDILTRSIGYRTVEGGGQVPAYAAYLKQQLIAAGFAEADVRFTSVGESGYLIARLPGRDRTAKPLAVIAHMDVVAARREDWQRDPFTAVVENGFVYGRGTRDMKGDIAMLIAALGGLRASGWTPGRDLILGFSGDEETQMATTARMSAAMKDAGLVLNADSGGGLLAEEDGRPIAFHLPAAEKTYADYTLTVTDPGGHSSRPTPGNPIYRLAKALDRLAAYSFPVQVTPLTRAFFAASAAVTSGPVGRAMRTLAADPGDAAATAVLAADPEYNGVLHTTCVATMIEGGHAANALPQRAMATVNCRIFPTTPMKDVERQLNAIVADPAVKIAYQPAGTFDQAESPLDPAVLAAVGQAVGQRVRGLTVIPSMEMGASDSMYFRAMGIPAFGTSAVFSRGSDDLSHGLDERVPLDTLDPGVAQWQAVIRALAR